MLREGIRRVEEREIGMRPERQRRNASLEARIAAAAIVYGLGKEKLLLQRQRI